MAKKKDLEDMLKAIKAELSKLKESKDELVQEVLKNINPILDGVKSEEEMPEECPSEEDESTEEEKVEEMNKDGLQTERKEEEKIVEEVKEIKKEDVTNGQIQNTSSESSVHTEPTKICTENKEEIKELSNEYLLNQEKFALELSQEVANKLKEAAIELDNKEKELLAKDEIINGYKAKIIEFQKDMEIKTSLEQELQKYKQKEVLMLQKQFDDKVQRLIELYATLGVQKTKKDFELNFNESQIDKLINDLSVFNVQSKPIRQTKVSAGLELNKFENNNKQNVPTAADRAKLLFNL